MDRLTRIADECVAKIMRYVEDPWIGIYYVVVGTDGEVYDHTDAGVWVPESEYYNRTPRSVTVYCSRNPVDWNHWLSEHPGRPDDRELTDSEMKEWHRFSVLEELKKWAPSNLSVEVGA